MSELPVTQSRNGEILNSEPHIFDPVILRAYDIRGEVGVNLGENDAVALGRAFGTFIRNKGGQNVCIGYDGRLSSPQLAEATIHGLLSTGIDVENIGLGPTPMLYFSVKDRMADGGIMITGSHNPPSHNGFKLTLSGGPVFGEAVQELGKIAESGSFAKGKGLLKDYSVQDSYIKRLLKDLNLARPLKIAWDPGNGVAGNVLQELVKQMPGEHILLNEKVDGNFPAHHPDPTVDENLKELRNAVLDNTCDMGIAFDGDGDRIGVLDSNGNVIRGDTLLTIYAREILETNPGSPIIGDIKCSQVFLDEIKRLGGKPVLWKTGHSLIKNKLAELQSPLAGELSGHIFFADKYYGFDDALYCSIRLMNEVAMFEKGLSEITAHMPRLFNTPEFRIDIDEDRKFGFIDDIGSFLKDNISEDAEIIDIDGIRMNLQNGWVLIRASNTQNVISLRMEAKSEEALNEIKGLVKIGFDKFGLPLNNIW